MEPQKQISKTSGDLKKIHYHSQYVKEFGERAFLEIAPAEQNIYSSSGAERNFFEKAPRADKQI